MPRDLDGLADVVVLTVKTALGPVLERLAVIDARLAIAAGAEQSVHEIRDRIVALETKAAMPRPPEVNLDAALAPLLQRLVVAETTLATLPTTERTIADLRDRVVTSETKSAVPVPAVPPDPLLGEVRDRVRVLETQVCPTTQEALGDVTHRVAVLEGRDVVTLPAVSGEDVTALRDRVVGLETRMAGPNPAETALGDLRDRVVTLERRVQDESVTKAIAAVSERVAVVEVRGQVPGPPGKDGKDGADGLGFEDLDVQFDGDRTIALKFERGLVKKSFPIALPFLRYHGVYIDGKSYAEGDVVTWAGSTWTAQTATSTKPGDGSKDWILAVKRGRDGKDGRDAPGALPIVSVGRVS